MKIKEIIGILNAETLHIKDEHQLDMDISSAAASDMMSTILALVKVPDLLLTGLNNSQVINTACVFGIKAVIIIQNKKVDPKVLELAKKEGISLFLTQTCMYESCGLLYGSGLSSIDNID